mmetsp:Transcript_14887/g.31170  ORF Transcript_14887/g.31170 Transcript_14887/m.31170 type:complete len:93 (-) Transcript_14887:3161-3439(-)
MLLNLRHYVVLTAVTTSNSVPSKRNTRSLTSKLSNDPRGVGQFAFKGGVSSKINDYMKSKYHFLNLFGIISSAPIVRNKKAHDNTIKVTQKP